MGANIWNSFPQAMRHLQKYRFKNNWEQKAAFLSVGSINVVVLLPLREIDNYFGRNV